MRDNQYRKGPGGRTQSEEGPRGLVVAEREKEWWLRPEDRHMCVSDISALRYYSVITNDKPTGALHRV